MKKLILFLLAFNSVSVNGQNLSKLSGKITMEQVKHLMIKYGEIKDTLREYNLKELYRLSHLNNKNRPYSLAAFLGYDTVQVTKVNYTKVGYNIKGCSTETTGYIYLGSSDQNFYTDSTLKVKCNYQYIVFSKDSNYGKMVNGLFLFQGICPLRISSKNLAAQDILKAYPNPFITEVSVVISLPNDDSHIMLSLYNESGRKLQLIYKGEIKKNQKKTFKIDGSFFEIGFYFLRLETSTGQIYTFKLFKNA